MIPRQAEDMIEKAIAPLRKKIDDLELGLKEIEDERNRLSRINSELVTAHNTLLLDGSRLQDRTEKLEAENERLRKALEEIEELGEDGCTAARLGNIAHAALI